MTIGSIRFRWSASAGVLVLTVALIGCAASAPGPEDRATSSSPPETQKTEKNITFEGKKLSSESPVVVFAPSQDSERQKKLEALAESNTRAAGQDSQGTAIQSEVQSQEGQKPQTSDQEPVTGPASGGTGETSGQTPRVAGTPAIPVDSAAPSTQPAPADASPRTVGGKMGTSHRN